MSFFSKYLTFVLLQCISYILQNFQNVGAFLANLLIFIFFLLSVITFLMDYDGSIKCVYRNLNELQIILASFIFALASKLTEIQQLEVDALTYEYFCRLKTPQTLSCSISVNFDVRAKVYNLIFKKLQPHQKVNFSDIIY